MALQNNKTQVTSLIYDFLRSVDVSLAQIFQKKTSAVCRINELIIRLEVHIH